METGKLLQTSNELKTRSDDTLSASNPPTLVSLHSDSADLSIVYG